LAGLEGYESQLKSVTGGEGAYNIEFSHYEAVPGDIQKRLCAEYQEQKN
jgi:elongation factor G